MSAIILTDVRADPALVDVYNMRRCVDVSKNPGVDMVRCYKSRAQPSLTAILPRLLFFILQSDSPMSEGSRRPFRSLSLFKSLAMRHRISLKRSPVCIMYPVRLGTIIEGPLY